MANAKCGERKGSNQRGKKEQWLHFRELPLLMTVFLVQSSVTGESILEGHAGLKKFLFTTNFYNLFIMFIQTSKES